MHSRSSGKADVPAEFTDLNAFGILRIAATLTVAGPTFTAHGDSTVTGRNQVQVS